MFYHAEFGRSMSKGVGINKTRRNPKNWGALGPAPLGFGVADAKKHALPTCYHA